MVKKLQCRWFKELAGIEKIIGGRLMALSEEFGYQIPPSVLESTKITREELQVFLNSEAVEPIAEKLNERLSNYVRQQRSLLKKPSKKRGKGTKKTQRRENDDLVKIQVRRQTRTAIDKICDYHIPRHDFVELIVNDFDNKFREVIENEEAESKKILDAFERKKNLQLERLKNKVDKIETLNEQVRFLRNQRRFLITLIASYEDMFDGVFTPNEVLQYILPKDKNFINGSKADVESALGVTSNTWQERRHRNGKHPLQELMEGYFEARYSESGFQSE